MELKMVYIGEQKSRFKFGETYTAISFTVLSTIILDKDNVPMEFWNDTIHEYFRQKKHWRNEQLEKLGI